jgi:UDP-2,4-diacetamido-2,4,6-trideoxy-beta-L-altropyranose hydrolase
MKKILFRADSSNQIGFGHLSRCLVLAKYFKNKGWACYFAIDKKTNKSLDLLKKNTFKYFLVEGTLFCSLKKILQNQSFEIVVIDHYGIDNIYENKCSEFVNKVVVIEDIANRKHSCDILIDQNLGRKKKDYHKFVTKDCKLLLGSDYCLLRDEFLNKKVSKKSNILPSSLKVFISFGASDFHDITSNVISIFLGLKLNFELIIVMGSISPNLNKIKKISSKNPDKIKLHVNSDNIRDLMENSDYAIGACGVTAWERCYMGLPTICIKTAENQNFIYKTLLRSQLIIDGGDWNNFSKKELLKTINLVSLNKELRKKISLKCKNLIDGQGVSRVYSALVGSE